MIERAITSLVVGPGESTLACMKKLDATAQKILFVVEGEGRLVGALTDGDIRRWILAGRDLTVPVAQVCNPSPVVLPANHIAGDVRALMVTHGVSCIPVVDDERRIRDLVFWTDLVRGDSPADVVSPRPVDAPVVIMAGGAGVRLRPFTTILPKALIPLGDKSIVEHIIDRFCRHGIHEYYMTLGHKARVIRSYFEDVERDYTLTFVEEPKPLGTAGGLLFLAGRLPSTFLVTNCDVLVRADYADLIDFHLAGGHAMTLVSSMRHYRIPYGICEIDPGGRLVEIREKPEMHFLISTGLYVVERSSLALIPEGLTFQMTDLIHALRAAGWTIGVYPISERAWDDTGEWDEYHKTAGQLAVEPPRVERPRDEAPSPNRLAGGREAGA